MKVSFRFQKKVKLSINTFSLKFLASKNSSQIHLFWVIIFYWDKNFGYHTSHQLQNPSEHVTSIMPTFWFAWTLFVLKWVQPKHFFQLQLKICSKFLNSFAIKFQNIQSIWFCKDTIKLLLHQYVKSTIAWSFQDI